MSDAADEPPFSAGGRRRWARSFRKAPQKATPAQKRALRELWPRFGIDLAYGELWDPETSFGGSAPLVLEVGSGLGETLAAVARRRPDQNFLGVEIHKPSLGASLRRLKEAEVTNVRLLRMDVMKLLNDHCGGGLFAEVWVLFPDPFSRPRDLHRRLMRPSFLRLVELRGIPGVQLRLATDVTEYAEHSDRLIDDSAGWRLVHTDRPHWRPVTKYEQIGIDEGRTIRDRLYQSFRSEPDIER